jgi:predicted RNA-binding protein (virulence factor B family)
VWLYRDNLTGRVVATTKLNPYVNNNDLCVRPKEQVDILVARRMEAGFRVVINNRHWGMIYNDQIFTPVAVGDRLTAYVHRISEEGRIDIMLQQEGKDQTDSAAAKLVELLKANKGALPIGDKSSPEEIAFLTGLSKKNFKRAVGALYKQRLVTIGEGEVKLN